MSQRHEPDNASAYDMLVASSKGFLLVLAVAGDYGFRPPELADTVATEVGLASGQPRSRLANCNFTAGNETLFSVQLGISC